MTEREHGLQRPATPGDPAGMATGGFRTQRIAAGGAPGSSAVDDPPRDNPSRDDPPRDNPSRDDPPRDYPPRDDSPERSPAESPRTGSGGTSATRTRARSTASGARGARRARLMLRRIDPWSTMKFSLVLSIVAFIIWIVAVALLYGLLAAMGVFTKIDQSIVQLIGPSSTGIESIISIKTVLTAAAVVGLVDIVLFTALATLGAVIYNLCADLVGGVEVTLVEAD